MSVQFTGLNAVLRRSYSFSQKDGWKEIRIEEGTPRHIYGRVPDLQRDGFNVSVSKDGPYAKLEAKRIIPTLLTPYVERWEIRSEIYEKDLFTLPAAMKEAYDYSKGPQAYKKSIQDVSKGDAAPLGLFAPARPFATLLLQELVRGVTSYESEYTILMRERVEPAVINPPSKPIQLASSRLIYTTAQLLVGMPSNVFFTLPDAPPSFDSTKEANTMWGWRARDQEAEMDQDFKVTTRETFLFTQWSTFLYDPA